MQKHVVLVSVAVAMCVAATVLGAVAGKKSKGFLRFEDSDGQQHCVYRRNPALGYGVAAALLQLTGMILATVASTDGLLTGVTLAVAVRRTTVAERQLDPAWLAALAATVMFLCGAAMKMGSSRPDWHGDGRYRYYGCSEGRSDLFFMASVVSGFATVFAIAAYVTLQLTDVDEAAPDVELEMGEPQGAQPHPLPPPVAAPPQYGHGRQFSGPVRTVR